jgi:hypothetical protein
MKKKILNDIIAVVPEHYTWACEIYSMYYFNIC